METTLLPAGKDPMGAAIADYFKHRKADRLRVFSSQFDEEIIIFALTKINVDDRNKLLIYTLTDEMFGKLYTDKGYISKITN